MSRETSENSRSMLWRGKPWIFPDALGRGILIIAIAVVVSWLELFFDLAYKFSERTLDTMDWIGILPNMDNQHDTPTVATGFKHLHFEKRQPRDKNWNPEFKIVHSCLLRIRGHGGHKITLWKNPESGKHSYSHSTRE